MRENIEQSEVFADAGRERSSAGWLTTYIDLFFNLMAFFIVVISISKLDEPRSVYVLGSIALAFGASEIVPPKFEIPVSQSILISQRSTDQPGPDAQQSYRSAPKLLKKNERQLLNFSNPESALEAALEVFAYETLSGYLRITSSENTLVFDLSVSKNEKGALSGEQLTIIEKIALFQEQVSSDVLIRHPEIWQGSKTPNSSNSLLLSIKKLFSNEIAAGDAAVKEESGEVFVSLFGDSGFELGQARLSPALSRKVRKLGPVLTGSDLAVEILGHTDNVPIGFSDTFRSNWELSAARASAVAEELIDFSELPGSRFSVSGLADTVPLESNDTASGRRQNRRIEIRLVRQD